MATPAAGKQIEVEGARELASTLKTFGSNVQDMKPVNADVASAVGSAATTAAPRQSGMLAASMRPSGTNAEAVIAFGGGAVPYANAIHWGTRGRPGQRGPHNIRPNHFATGAVERTQTTWVPKYTDRLRDLLQRVRGA